jgi:Exostosin family
MAFFLSSAVIMYSSVNQVSLILLLVSSTQPAGGGGGGGGHNHQRILWMSDVEKQHHHHYLRSTLPLSPSASVATADAAAVVDWNKTLSNLHLKINRSMLDLLSSSSSMRDTTINHNHNEDTRSENKNFSYDNNLSPFGHREANDNKNSRQRLKVYVYDDTHLPSYLSSDLIEETIQNAYNMNHVTEIVLIRLFESFDGRTYDPNEADIFVVPYPHIAHCHTTPGYKLHCGNVEFNSTRTRTSKTKKKKRRRRSTRRRRNHQEGQGGDDDDDDTDHWYHILQYLPYYNRSTANKHMFIIGDGEWMSHRWFFQHHDGPIAFYGPRWEDYDEVQRQRDKGHRTSPHTHIIIPPFNSYPEFQPSVVLQRLQQEEKQEQEEMEKSPSSSPSQQQRTLALTFVAGTINRVMGKQSPRRFRGYFMKALNEVTTMSTSIEIRNVTGSKLSLRTTTTNTPTIAGMPFIARNHIDDEDIEKLYKLYRKSILCPVLPGDMPWQRRFFDVMACGCLPLVVSFPLSGNSVRQQRRRQSGSSDSDSANRTSWYTPEGGGKHVWSVEESYPFVKSVYVPGFAPVDDDDDERADEEQFGVDYRSFVVECPGNITHPEDMSHIVRDCIEPFLLNPIEISRRQRSLRRAVISTLYGVGDESHRYNDAFSHLVHALERIVVKQDTT